MRVLTSESFTFQGPRFAVVLPSKVKTPRKLSKISLPRFRSSTLYDTFDYVFQIQAIVLQEISSEAPWPTLLLLQ